MNRKLTTSLMLSLAVTGLAACAENERQYDPITPISYLQTHQEPGRLVIPAETIAQGPDATFTAVRQAAYGFTRDGSGPLHLVVSARSEAEATRQARMIAMAFRDNGIGTDRLAVTTVSAPPYGAVATYQRVAVNIPDCPDVPVKSSPFGCSVDRQIGRMVARTGDLVGNDRLDPASSLPTANAVNRYRTDTPPPQFPPLLVRTTDVTQQ
jgi:type IV pilus biogenesis protein CpaD/CtpE